MSNLYKPEVEATVRIGDGVVSIKRKGSSQIVQANVVSTEAALDGQTTRLWLDRLVHAAHEVSIGGHPVTGAIVSELLLTH